jgi:hypothetical protein
MHSISKSLSAVLMLGILFITAMPIANATTGHQFGVDISVSNGIQGFSISSLSVWQEAGIWHAKIFIDTTGTGANEFGHFRFRCISMSGTKLAVVLLSDYNSQIWHMTETMNTTQLATPENSTEMLSGQFGLDIAVSNGTMGFPISSISVSNSGGLWHVRVFVSIVPLGNYNHFRLGEVNLAGVHLSIVSVAVSQDPDYPQIWDMTEVLNVP